MIHNTGSAKEGFTRHAQVAERFAEPHGGNHIPIEQAHRNGSDERRDIVATHTDGTFVLPDRSRQSTVDQPEHDHGNEE